MNDRRIARLQEQIKQRLAELLQRDVADPKSHQTAHEEKRETRTAKADAETKRPDAQENRGDHEPPEIRARAADELCGAMPACDRGREQNAGCERRNHVAFFLARSTARQRYHAAALR